MKSLITSSSAIFIGWLSKAPNNCEWGIYPTKYGSSLYWISYDC